MRILTAFSFCLIILISTQARSSLAETQDFATTYVAPGYGQSFFLDLSFRSAALAFDSSDNLYLTDIDNDRVLGVVNVLRYLKETDYETFDTPYNTYNVNNMAVNGLDFDSVGNLYVSEFYSLGDRGLIRVAANPSDKIIFPDFRPTGIAFNGNDTIYFPGRKYSDLTFGNIYKNESFELPETIFIEGLVAYAIAIDNTGQIYLGLQDNSVWTLDTFTGVRVKIASFVGGYVEELAFDSTGELYVLEGGRDADNSIWTIIKLGVPPNWTGIDIKPGSSPNCINAESKGNIPVAILGGSVDVKNINIETILIDDSDPSTPNLKPYKESYKDVNKDGYTDIILHFKTEDLLISGLILDGNVLSVSFKDSYDESYLGADVIYKSGGPNCF